MPMPQQNGKPYKVGTQQAAMQRFAAGPKPTAGQQIGAAAKAVGGGIKSAAIGTKSAVGGAVAGVRAVHTNLLNNPNSGGVKGTMRHNATVMGKANAVGVVAQAATGVLAARAAVAGAKNPAQAKAGLASLQAAKADNKQQKQAGGLNWSAPGGGAGGRPRR